MLQLLLQKSRSNFWVNSNIYLINLRLFRRWDTFPENVWFHLELVHQCSGSVSALILVAKSGSRSSKMTHKNIKVKTFHVLKCWMFSFRDDGFSCRLDILYGGLGINKLLWRCRSRRETWTQTSYGILRSWWKGVNHYTGEGHQFSWNLGWQLTLHRHITSFFSAVKVLVIKTLDPDPN
jgi:hypothetical protein